jgi:hypothetical protein
LQLTVLPPACPLPESTAHCVAAEYAPPSSEISQSYVKGEVPEEGIVPLTDSAWSESISASETVGAAGAASWVATTMFVLDDEVADSGEVALSDTFSSAAYVCPAERALPAIAHVTVFPDACPVPEFAAHCVACA